MDYASLNLEEFKPVDFHDFDHLVGDANIRLGRRIAHDLATLAGEPDGNPKAARSQRDSDR